MSAPAPLIPIVGLCGSRWEVLPVRGGRRRGAGREQRRPSRSTVPAQTKSSPSPPAPSAPAVRHTRSNARRTRTRSFALITSTHGSSSTKTHPARHVPPVTGDVEHQRRSAENRPRRRAGARSGDCLHDRALVDSAPVANSPASPSGSSRRRSSPFTTAPSATVDHVERRCWADRPVIVALITSTMFVLFQKKNRRW